MGKCKGLARFFDCCVACFVRIGIMMCRIAIRGAGLLMNRLAKKTSGGAAQCRSTAGITCFILRKLRGRIHQSVTGESGSGLQNLEVAESEGIDFLGTDVAWPST